MLMAYTHQTSRRRPPSRFFPVEAEELLRAGEVVGATELCKQGLVYFPENISGYVVLAQAYLMLDQPVRALNVLENGYRRTKAEGLRALCGEIIQGNTSEEEVKSEDELEVEESRDEVEKREFEADEMPIEAEAIQTQPELSVADSDLADTVGEKEFLDARASDELRGETVPKEVVPSADSDESAIKDDGVADLEPDDASTEEEELSQVEESGEVPPSEDGETGVGSSKESIGLSIHSGTNISRLRSSNLRLIPGLEFAPLRRDESKLKIAPLVNPPVELDLPTPEQEEVNKTSIADAEVASETNAEELNKGISESIEVGADNSEEEMTQLEELARRLETAHIPIVEGKEETETQSPAFEPSIISDTFADILAQQGAYEEAIKAYQVLAKAKPEQRRYYEHKIAELRWKMTSITNDRSGHADDKSHEKGKGEEGKERGES